MFFRYLQIRHALRAQFANGFPNPQTLPIVDVITGADPSKLISTLYNILRTRSVSRIIDMARTRWEDDVGPIEAWDWDEILENNKKVSPRLSERLTQLYIIHKSYFTPARIAKYHPNSNPLCPRCAGHPWTFYHLIWTCPEIQNYWAQIIQFLHDHMGSPLQLDPKSCLMGLLPDVKINQFLATFLYETLFSARKLVAKNWMRNTPPTIQAWIREINLNLPYKKVIYRHRGCSAKYNKVWDRWLDTPDTYIE